MKKNFLFDLGDKTKDEQSKTYMSWKELKKHWEKKL